MAHSARTVIATEAAAIRSLEPRIDSDFVAACRLILACEGRVVVIGMGKSGHVARKIAATLASTGTPAFFVHPGEASHGDLGMILPQDVVLALSNSGETDELLFILPVIKRQGIPLIAMTGNPSPRWRGRPTCTWTSACQPKPARWAWRPPPAPPRRWCMGDALAIALLEARGFTADDFARSHPAGSLGRRLLLHIGDIMHTGDGCPRRTRRQPHRRRWWR